MPTTIKTIELEETSTNSIGNRKNGKVCFNILWILFVIYLAFNDCWITSEDDPQIKRTVVGFGLLVLFMLFVEQVVRSVEQAVPSEDPHCCSLSFFEGGDKEFDSFHTKIGKFGYCVYYFTVICTQVAVLRCILSLPPDEVPMWYSEGATMHMYGFLMLSNAAGYTMWSVVHMLVFSLTSDSIALSTAQQVVMNPRSLGFIIGCLSVAYEVILRRNDKAFVKHHLQVPHLTFFALICIPISSIIILKHAPTSVANFCVIGVCVLLCSMGQPNKASCDTMRDSFRYERFLSLQTCNPSMRDSFRSKLATHLYHASIWTQIALALMEYLEGYTRTRNLWIVGFLLYAHIGSMDIRSVCFVWGITVLGAFNTYDGNKVDSHFPLLIAIAIARSIAMMCVVVDGCCYKTTPKEKGGEETKPLREDNNTPHIDYVPLQDIC